MNELLRRLLCLPEQASDTARAIDTLHYVVISVTMAGATLVAVLAGYFIVRYRRRGAPGPTPRVHLPRPAEVALIGGTLTLFLVFWVVGYLQYLGLREPPRDALDVYVTAKQWMWKFAQSDGRSDVGVLVVPAGRNVRLLMTSQDVIHSFYVPALRIKQDVLPGRYVTAWFRATRPGTYDVLCAEYCGLSHSRMRAALVVLPAAEYTTWLEGAPRQEPESDGLLPASERAPHVGAGPSLAAIGRTVAVRRGCLGCHTVDGQRHIGPSWRALYDSDVALATGQHVRADGAYLTRSMMDPQADVVAGFTPVMPVYFGVLQPPEVAALVEYIRSLREQGPAPSVRLPTVLPGGVIPQDAGGTP